MILSSRTLSASTDSESRNFSFFSDILLSISLHLIVFILIPFMAKQLWQHENFVRPHTFQLISVPPVETKSIKKIPKAAVTPKKETTPKTSPKRDPRPSREKVSEENLNELEDLLGGLSEPVSDINLKDPFPYSWYIRMVMNKVESNWKPPIENPDIFVVVRFSIFTNGSISDVQVTKSSGNVMIDNLAVRTVSASAPFGQLPPAYREDHLDIDYTLRPSKK